MIRLIPVDGKTADWPRKVAQGINYLIGRVGEVTSLANGGTGSSLTDPNADRLLFWDDSAGAVAWLEAGAGLTITGTTIASSAGVTDGDKGDITVSGTGAVWSIDNGAVTLAKQADVATGTVFYRKTAGTGSPEVQTLATLKTDLGLTGTNSGDQTITLTGDVTGSGTGSFAATVANDAITNAKLANVATATIKGRVTASTGDPEDLTGTQATTLLDTFTSSLKGLAPASGGGTANFLRADGTWAAPSGAANPETTLPTMPTGWTNVNVSGTRFVTEYSGKALVIGDTSTTGGPQLHGAYIAHGLSSPYRIVAPVRIQAQRTGFMLPALGWRESSSGKLMTFYPLPTANTYQMDNWNSATSRNAVVSTASTLLSSDTAHHALLWMAIRNDGTNIYFEVSADRNKDNFVTMYSRAISGAFLSTFDQLFLGMYQETATGRNARMIFRGVDLTAGLTWTY